MYRPTQEDSVRKRHLIVPIKLIAIKKYFVSALVVDYTYVRHTLLDKLLTDVFDLLLRTKVYVFYIFKTTLTLVLLLERNIVPHLTQLQLLHTPKMTQ